jgi:hypothetical protein
MISLEAPESRSSSLLSAKLSCSLFSHSPRFFRNSSVLETEDFSSAALSLAIALEIMWLLSLMRNSRFLLSSKRFEAAADIPEAVPALAGEDASMAKRHVMNDSENIRNARRKDIARTGKGKRLYFI